MEEAKKIKQKFLTHTSHELRKQLSVIFACCYLLRETLQGTLSADQLRQLNKIEHGARKIHDLTKKLIDLTDVNEIKKVVTKKTVTLTDRPSLIAQ
jgi:K+-sensing histidine kinase KdpD